jgi:F-type H+-transporting ATPase subunit a
VNVSLAPETIFHLGHFAITNSILSGWLVTIGMLVFAFVARRSIATIPGKIQSSLELVYEWIWDLTNNIIDNEKVSRELFPYLITVFLFIVLSNWSGLLPGVGAIGIHEHHHGKDVLVPLFRAPTTDVNTTLVLALFSMGYVQYLGIKYAGTKDYLGRFFTLKNPMMSFLGLIELMGELVRVISFTFRLFGNIFAGEVLLTTMLFLTTTLLPYVAIIPLPFFFLETIVGVFQAFIFCFLTVIFTSLAITSHGDEEHAEAHGSHGALAATQ